MNDDLGRMVLNPDVTVRSRGVMEKCSMCIQKTQKTILDAKRDGREVKDGEFQTACSAACSNGAMVFGDINDKESKVAKLKEDDRMYHLLESVGTKPNVQYHTKVRNTTKHKLIKEINYIIMASHYEAPIRRPLVTGEKSITMLL